MVPCIKDTPAAPIVPPILKGTQAKEQALVVGAGILKSTGTPAEWHARLCHVPLPVLKQAAAASVGMEMTPGDLAAPCPSCVEGKLKRRPFPLSDSRAKMPLEEVHADLIGKMHETSASGNNHALLIVDDYSRRSWIIGIATP